MNVKKVFVVIAALFALASLAAEPSAALKIDSLDEVKKIAAQNSLKEIKSGPDDYLAVSEDSKSFACWRVKDERDDTIIVSIVCLDEKVHSRVETIVKRGLKLKYILGDGEKICSAFFEETGEPVQISENMLLYFAIISINEKCQLLRELEKTCGVVVPAAAKDNDANFEKTLKKKKSAVRKLDGAGMKPIIESYFVF